MQLSIDARKRFAWPAYVANLRARWECPVCLLVVAADASVARWATKPISLGDGNVFAPRVLGPDGGRYVFQGRAEGRAEIITRQLTAKFGPLSAEVRAQIASSSVEELIAIGDHLLSAGSLQEALLIPPGYQTGYTDPPPGIEIYY